MFIRALLQSILIIFDLCRALLGPDSRQGRFRVMFSRSCAKAALAVTVQRNR